IDGELPAGRDDREVVEGEETADVRERGGRQDRSAVVEPGDRVARVRGVHTGLVEIVPDGDAVQVVERSLVVDDLAGGRVEQNRDLQGPGEGDPDRDERRPRRVLLRVLFDGVQGA